MKGKRPYRRKHMVDPRSRAMAQAPLKSLQRAHMLLESGDHANAATIFEQLASEAMDFQLEKPAPFLYLQAARARFLSGSSKAGAERVRQGIGLLIEANRLDDLDRMVNRLEVELPAFGQEALLAEVKGRVEETQGSRREKSPKPQRTAPRRVICPQCSAALHPDLLVWDRPGLVECVYCASVIEVGK